MRAVDTNVLVRLITRDVPRRFLKGPWELRGVVGYKSPGTRACGVPVRFFGPPEITLHALRRGGG